MTIINLRKATRKDYQRLEDAAVRFAKRHEYVILEENPVASIEETIGYGMGYGIEKAQYHNKLWHACVGRALRWPGADGVAYGNVFKRSK